MTSLRAVTSVLTIAVAVLSGCSRGGPASTPSTTSAGGGSRVLAPGVYDETLRTADGRTRTYRVYVPKVAAANRSVPVVLAQHGRTGWGTQFEQSSGLDRVADERGFVVVYPDGVGSVLAPERTRTWNAGGCCGPAVAQSVDDVAFLRAVLDQVEARVPVDRGHTFVIGHSNGAMMAYRLACEIADRVAAIAVQAGPLDVSPCRPSVPVSLLHLHGTADMNAPVAGGQGSGVSGYTLPPSITGVRTIAAADGCGPEPRRTVDPANGDVVTDTWSGCRNGTSVAFVQVTGASHAWMGRPTLVPSAVGTPDAKLDATMVLVDFALAHPRP